MLKEYIQTVISVAIIVSVALSLSHPKLRGAAGFGAGILIICIIMLPLVDIINNFSIEDGWDGFLDDYIYENMTDDAIELAFECGIEEYISEKYAIDRDLINVNADGFNLENMRCERVYVTLRGKAALADYKKIQTEIEQEFTVGGECEVSVIIG